MTPKKFPLTKLATGVLLGLTLAACGSDSTEPQATPDTEQPKVIEPVVDKPALGQPATGEQVEPKPVASISGVSSAVDSGNGLLTGTVTLSDQQAFAEQTDTVTKFGSFSISATGAWTFNVIPTSEAYLEATAEQALTEEITIASAEGNEYKITVTTTGKNDAPVFDSGDGKDSASFDYASAKQVTGTLAISDPDAEQSKFVAQSETQGYFGTFSMAENGNWQYSLFEQAPTNINPASSSVYSREGANTVETFTVTSADGSTHQVAVSIENHGEYQQVFQTESFTFDLAKGESSLADLLDTTKLSAILASADIAVTEFSQYNDAGDIVLKNIFNTEGELTYARNWAYSEQNGQFFREYSYDRLYPDGVSSIGDIVDTWDLAQQKLVNSKNNSAKYSPTGEHLGSNQTEYGYLYTELGLLKQKYYQHIFDSDTGDHKPSQVFTYADNGNRLSRIYYSSGRIYSEYVFDAGKEVGYKRFNRDGSLARYSDHVFIDDKQVHTLEYTFDSSFSGESYYPREATYKYYDQLGGLDYQAKVKYTEDGDVDIFEPVQVTQYIYNPSLKLSLNYSYYLDLTNNNKYYSLDANGDPNTTSIDINITRYVTTKCGKNRQLSHGIYAPTKNMVACPITAPLPPKINLTKQADVIAAVFADSEAAVVNKFIPNPGL